MSYCSFRLEDAVIEYGSMPRNHHYSIKYESVLGVRRRLSWSDYEATLAVVYLGCQHAVNSGEVLIKSINPARTE